MNLSGFDETINHATANAEKIRADLFRDHFTAALNAVNSLVCLYLPNSKFPFRRDNDTGLFFNLHLG